MNCTDVFTKELKKKINKTREGRGGNGIYKRRNRRSYRVIIHYKTYLNIIENYEKILENYKCGYVVRIKPNEYFEENGDIKDNFPKTLKLGVNAFIYFKLIKDWNKYGAYCSNFKEIVELETESETVNNNDQWIGHYCKFIKNSNPQKISLICSSGEKTDKQEKEFENLKNTYGESLPQQAGLGNYDYDYATKDEIKNVCYQLSMMIFKVPKMKAELMDRNKELTKSKIEEVEKHIIEYCKNKKLLDFEKLGEIRALDEINHYPICPLCLDELDARSFFENAEQDEGREEEDNTQKEIVLMHIDALAPGKFNHRTYNLGWGHKHCNTIQGSASIDEALENLKKILKNNQAI